LQVIDLGTLGNVIPGDPGGVVICVPKSCFPKVTNIVLGC
jgi:hypothetical protein